MNADVGKAIDSRCFAPDAGGADSLCGQPATTWVKVRGTYRYICPDHAADVDRFGGTDDDHPRVSVCDRCLRLTPTGAIADGACHGCK